MLREISTRVEKAFSDLKVVEYSKEYLGVIRANLRQIDDNYKSTTLLLLLLAAMFELITRAAIAEVTIGPLKLKDFSLVYKLIPVVFAYGYYNLLALFVVRRLLRFTHDSIIEKLYKPITDNELDHYLLPPPPFITELRFVRGTSKLSVFVAAIGFFLLEITHIAPLAFEVYAFYQLFIAFGTADILTWLVLILSIILTIQGILVFVWPFSRK